MSYPVGYKSLLHRILRVGNVEANPRYVKVTDTSDNPLLTMEFINTALTRLDDELTAAIQDYRVETTQLTLLPGVNAMGLPYFFSKLRRIWYTEGDRQVDIEKMMLAEQSRLSSASALGGWGERIYYDLFGDNLRFAPTPTQTYDISIEYDRTTPQFTDPNLDESLDFVNGWDRFIVFEVGALICEMEGRDGSAFQGRAERELAAIKLAAMDRDQANPEHMVYLPNDVFYYRSRT